MNSSRNRRIAGTVAAIVIVFAAGTWLWARRSPRAQAARDSLQIAVAGLPPGEQKKLKDAGLVIHGALSKEEQEKRISDFAAQGRKKMLDDYFAMDPAARKAHLDKLIEEQEKMKKMLGDLDNPSTQPSFASSKDGSVRIVRKFGGSDPAAQKQMAEDIPPVDRARMAEMLADLNARRAERGLPPSKGLMMIRLSSSGTK